MDGKCDFWYDFLEKNGVKWRKRGLMDWKRMGKNG